MSPKPMKVVRFHEYGDSSKLILESIDRPKPQANEVLVRVHYAGVNPIDWKLRSGLYQSFMPVKFPHTPGIDVSGIVEEVGSEVTRWKKGDSVFGIGKGSYAEFTLANEKDLCAKPEKLSYEEAATLPVGALTAWKAVEDSGLKAGQKVLVHAGAGGVGLFALQFAKLKGAQVYATASSKNLDFVKRLGAFEAIDYALGPIENKVKDFDVVLDNVGGSVLDTSFALVKKDGVLVTVAGQPSQEKAVSFGIKALSSGRGSAEHLKEIAELVVSGKVSTVVQKVFTLSQTKEAHDLSQSGHGRGRIVIHAV